MSPQSHAYQRLEALYQGLLLKMERREWRARRAGGMRMEPLPPRRLLSVTPVGSETLINSNTLGTQDAPDVSISSSGGIAYAWANGDHSDPATAMRGNGEYVVVWMSGGDIHARLYNANQTPNSAEFLVNENSSGSLAHPDVAMNSTGDFVVTWEGQGNGVDGIWARRFNTDGTPKGASFQVNVNTSSNQHDPAVAMADDGSFLITHTNDSNGQQIRARFYDAAGIGQGEFAIDAGDKADHSSVAATGSGNYVVTWSAQTTNNRFMVKYRRYSGTSALDASGVVVDSSGTGNQVDNSVAVDFFGNFLVAWDEQLRDGSGLGIFGRHFFADGTADGASFGVNTTTLNNQQQPAVAMNANGDAVIAWSGNGPGDNAGIFAQRFSTANLAPVNTVPAAQTTAEDTGLVFSAANGNAISVSDTDAGTNPLQVSLGVTSGTLTLASRGGLSFTSGDGTADAVMTFTGTLAAINNALDGLTFTPPADASGLATLGISTNDLGNNAPGGAQIDTDTVAINVTAVNDAPVNTLPPSQPVSGGGTLTFSASGGNAITVGDVDAAASALQVTLKASDGTLTLGSIAGLTFSSGDGSADSDMTFSGTLAAINNALDGLTYSAPSVLSGNVSIDVTTNDLGNTGAGGAQIDSETLVLGNPPANNPPVNTVPGAQDMDEDGNLVFSASNGNGISVDDENGGVKVTLSATHGTLTLSDITGLTFGTGTGIGDPSMQFTGSLADINNALRGMVFSPDANFNGAASIQIVSEDGSQTATDSIAISVHAVDDAPVNVVPAAQGGVEDTPLVFSVADGNAISITDIDAGSGVIQVSLSVTQGNLTLSGTSGLSFVHGDGTADDAMVIWGTRSAINAALDGLIYTPDAEFNGSATLMISTNDLGNTGKGSANTDSDSVTISISAVNDAPVVSTPPQQSVAEEGHLTFSSGAGNAVTIGDVDADGGIVLVSLSTSNGTLTLNHTSGLTFSTGDGKSDAAMTFSGTLTDINAALNGMVFRPAANFSGAVGVGVAVNDLGNSGGGAQSASGGVGIIVTPVNDKPVNIIPRNQSTSIDVPLVFSAANGNPITVTDIDAGSGDLRVTLKAQRGTLTLSTTAGLTFSLGDGTDDKQMTFTGTLTEINAALDGMVFTPGLDFVSDGSVQIQTNDLGNTGAGGARSDDDTIRVKVVADGPTITVPDAQVIGAAQNLVFSEQNANELSFTDPDATSVQVTLNVVHGTLTLGNLAGLTFLVGDGTADDNVTFIGTVRAANGALDGLIFTSDSTFSGDTLLEISVSDRGTGKGGITHVASGSVVLHVNDAPTTVGLDDVTVAEDADPTQISVAAKFNDPQGLALSYALADNSNIDLFDSITIDPVTGDVVVRYAHDAFGTAQLIIRATDSDGLHVDATFLVTVTPVNDAPVLAANPMTIDLGATAAISSGALRLTDVDNDSSQLRYTLTQLPDLGEIRLSGVTLGVGDTFTQADIDNGLVSYVNTSVGPTDGFTFTADDGAGGSVGANRLTIRVQVSQSGPLPLPPPVVPSPPQDSPSPSPSPLDDSKKDETRATGGTAAAKDSGPSAAPSLSHSGSSGSGSDSAPSAAEAAPVTEVAPPVVTPAQPQIQQPPAAPRPAPSTPMAAAPAPPRATIAPPPPPPVPVPPPPPAEAVAFIATPGNFWHELDQLHEQVAQKDATVFRLVAGTASFLSLGMSVVYILWSIRAGYLVASLVSSMPAWQFVDPLPILDGDPFAKSKRGTKEDEESLESLVTTSGGLT